jgi:hypothetical protein
VNAWSHPDEVWLREVYPHHTNAVLADYFRRSRTAIGQKARKLGLTKSPGLKGRNFEHGHATWNAGRKGWQAGGRSVQTQFKTGELSGAALRNHRPIGSELTDKDGNVIRKVSDTGNRRKDWRPVHVLVWEAVNGPLPAGHIVIFADRNNRNFVPSNLQAITRAENMRRNSYLTRYPKDVADLIRMRGVLNRKINNRSKA